LGMFKLLREKENALTGGPVRAWGSLSDWTIAWGDQISGGGAGAKNGVK